MTDKTPTPQEEFWSGEFGNEYIKRNSGKTLLASNIRFFSRALRSAGRISSCVEFGANIGMNLKAIRALYPEIELMAIEINPNAARELSLEIGEEKVFQGSIFDFAPSAKYDLSLIKGVLIHINPDKLNETYEKIYHSSNKFILICEYYNPTPVSLSYRGHDERLFKRDFAGEIMDRYPNLSLIDYGFSYHRDPAFPQDDITWFLLKKD